MGSAVLHRHFPSRWPLPQAVLTDRVRALCDRAEELRALRRRAVDVGAVRPDVAMADLLTLVTRSPWPRRTRARTRRSA
ncbi:hypothetical protein [Nonomuraea maritima]|uniref:hypothetical protein n=1 Tax=Nonomuraea maritima TaxID=683260 RepID=UPI003718B1EA